MLVYKTKEWQSLEDLDVVMITKSYGTFPYIVWYNMETTSFILYSLSGHSIPMEYVWTLDADSMEWEYLGHVWDVAVLEQIKMAWPNDSIAKNVEFYLSQIK